MHTPRYLKTMISQERIIDAQAEIEAIRADDPTAKLPTAEQIIAAEDAGLIWNFETGQADEANPEADARQIHRIAVAQLETVDYRGKRVPVIGTISAKGIGIYTVD